MSEEYGFVYDRWPSVYAENVDLETLTQVDIMAHLPAFPGASTDMGEYGEDEPILMAASANTEAKSGIRIICPRSRQTTIAPERDFYVVGKFDDDVVIGDHAELSIKLYIKKGRRLIRHVRCNKKDDKEHLFISKETDRLFPVALDPQAVIEADRKNFYESVRESCIPDLVYDSADDSMVAAGQIPASLKYSWNKAYYTDCYFTALISGGVYTDNRNWQSVSNLDENGHELYPLGEGEFILTAELNDENGTHLYAELPIKMGFIDNKILAAFSYPNHMRALFRNETFDTKNHRTILWDPLPGIWNCRLLEGGVMGMPWRKDGKKVVFSFWVNERRVYFNDAAEYKGGSIHAINYGISETSNARTVELAEICNQNYFRKRDNQPKIKVSQFVYKYGEPTNIPGINQTAEEFGNYYETTDVVKFLQVIVNGKRMPCDENMTINIHSTDKVELFAACKLFDEQCDLLTRRDENGKYADVDRIYRISYSFHSASGEQVGYQISDVFPLVRQVEFGEKVVVPKEDVYQFNHELWNLHSVSGHGDILIKLWEAYLQLRLAAGTMVLNKDILRVHFVD